MDQGRTIVPSVLATYDRSRGCNRDDSYVSVIALIAFAVDGDERKALEAGCDGYITKPIDTRKTCVLSAHDREHVFCRARMLGLSLEHAENAVGDHRRATALWEVSKATTEILAR